MTKRQTLDAISPFFIVSDTPRSMSFYLERLGFEVRYAEPKEKPHFAIVGRDSVQIFVKSASKKIAAQPNHTRHEDLPWDAFVYVEDPDALAGEFASREVTFHKEITNRTDGLRGFEIADPDGYVLFFGRPN